MKDIHWSTLLSSLRSGTCALVLGFEIPVISRGVAVGKSLRDVLGDDLARQLQEDGQEILEQYFPSISQQYVDSAAFATVSLKHVAADFFSDPTHAPGPIEVGLAQLPISFALTTRGDDLFARALIAAGKHPVRYWYHYRGEPRDNRELEGGFRPDAPTVYHLFGAYDEPNSLVLTENDLLDLVVHLIAGRPKLPDSVRNALRNKTFLFVGFDLRDWFTRVFVKLVMRALDISEPSMAVEYMNWPNTQEKEQTVLYYKRGKIEVVHADAEAFVHELRARYEKMGDHAVAPTPQRIRRANVFISYERSDDALARRIFDELPRDQFECWLDTALLQAGDDWNLELEDKLKSCDYFMVLSSENLARKDVGYVHKEIALALDQQKYRSPGTKFIIPCVVGGMDPAVGRRDLQSIQQYPLRPESFSEDLRELARTLWRDFQRRNR